MSVAKKRPDSLNSIRFRALHSLVFCCILFSALFITIDLSSDEAEAAAGSNVIVTIAFDEPNAFVDVKPGSAPQTSYEGEVVVRGDFGGGRIDINLEAQTNKEGFLAAVFPMQIMMTRPYTGYRIRLDVTAPLRTNYTDGVIHPPVWVTVEGDWLSYPSGVQGRIANSTVMLNVNQFYDISVYADPPFQKIWPGTKCYFDIWIQNMGNGVDMFELSIVNDEFYATMGFTFFADTWQIDIGPNMEDRIKLTVCSPQRITIYESKMVSITLKITSKRSKMYEDNMNPESTIYDILVHSKGAGIFYYFSAECWAMFLLAFCIIIVGLYNTVIYKRGRKKGVKRPVREHWRRKKESWKASRARRKEQARARRELRNQKRAESKAKKDEERRRKEAEKKSKAQDG